MALSLKLTEFALPSQEYEADAMWPMVRHGAVSLVLDRFALRDDKRVEARVEVRLAYESFMTFWATVEGDQFSAKFQDWLAANPLQVMDGPKDGDDPAQGRAVVRAHMARLSFVGSDAEMSFYAIPASHMSEAITDPSITSVPVVGVLRVTTSSHAVARLVAACARVAAEVGPMMKRGEVAAE